MNPLKHNFDNKQYGNSSSVSKHTPFWQRMILSIKDVFNTKKSVVTGAYKCKCTNTSCNFKAKLEWGIPSEIGTSFVKKDGKICTGCRQYVLVSLSQVHECPLCKKRNTLIGKGDHCPKCKQGILEDVNVRKYIKY